MKGIIITEKNYNFVTSRLIKFFSHKNFLSWHQWNCGMKKRIGHVIKFDKYNSPRIDVRTRYQNVKIRWNSPIGYERHLCIDLDEDSTIGFAYGDVVWFLGSRIIVKKFLHKKDLGIVYECFQIDK